MADKTPAQIAVARIQDAIDSNASWLNIGLLALESLPPEIGKLTNLDALYLFNNQLTSLPQAARATRCVSSGIG